MLAKTSAKTARTRNQTPTPATVQPVQRFTVGACASILSKVACSVRATANVAAKTHPAIVVAATVNAVTATAKPPIANV